MYGVMHDGVPGVVGGDDDAGPPPAGLLGREAERLELGRVDEERLEETQTAEGT